MNPTIKPVTIPQLRQRKQRQDNGQYLTTPAITVLTAYDYSTAKLLDGVADLDCILVGDSLGMVALGYENTLQVTMADMLHHVKAVRRGVKRAVVIGDMPFASVSVSKAQALDNIYKMMQEGQADCVKIEGASPYLCEIIAHAVDHGIPVMGHLGLTPQSVRSTGGYAVQGKQTQAAEILIESAQRLEQAGVFAMVIELTAKEVAALVTQAVSVPTIGIGAGIACDGQVLVTDDLLGKFTDFSPKFVRHYQAQSETVPQAITTFVEDVRRANFPSLKESFDYPKADISELNNLAQKYQLPLLEEMLSLPTYVKR